MMKIMDIPNKGWMNKIVNKVAETIIRKKLDIDADIVIDNCSVSMANEDRVAIQLGGTIILSHGDVLKLLKMKES